MDVNVIVMLITANKNAIFCCLDYPISIHTTPGMGEIGPDNPRGWGIWIQAEDCKHYPTLPYIQGSSY